MEYLADPHLVRQIQERLGVRQISDTDLAGTPPPHTPSPDAEQRRQSVGDDAGAVKAASVASNGLVNGYRWLSSKTRKRVKTPESTSPASSPEPANIVVETFPLFNIFFRLASELGHEPFYITYFPFLIWNIDTAMGRHVVVLWCVSMYVGQACKALFKRKRPPCPPAIRLVSNPLLETEYGLPSTHATVATTIPFYHLYCLHHRYNVRYTHLKYIFSVWAQLLCQCQYWYDVFCCGWLQLSLWFGLPVALFWCFSVCLSRVYLGVHTVLVRIFQKSDNDEWSVFNARHLACSQMHDQLWIMGGPAHRRLCTINIPDLDTHMRLYLTLR